MNHIILNNGRRVAVHYLTPKPAPGELPLVLLHGFCEDSSLWEGLMAGWNQSSVIAIDLPGFGQSDQPERSEMAAYADAVEAVLDALSVQRCVLVGHSLGGYVALEFAAARSGRLAGIGLFHSHPYPDDEARKLARTRGAEMVLTGKRDLYVAQLFPNLFAPAYAQANPEVIGAMIARGRQQSPEGIAAALQAMKSRPDRQHILMQATCPVLLLLGAEDNLVPLPQAWQMAMLSPLTSMEVMPGVAHMGMFEATERCAGVLRQFYALAKLFL